MMASIAAEITTTGHHFDLDTGLDVLDFANTLEGRYDLEPHEQLRDYHDLLVFSLLAGTLDQSTADQLAQTATQQPDASEQQLAAARELREAIFAIFAAITEDRAPDDRDLRALNRVYQQAMAHGAAIHDGEEFTWGWEDEREALDRPLWPLAKSAVDLLLTGDLRRLRKCAADDCGWLFYDTSRNQSRRWCSMQSCGNRATVAQFRERKRGTRDG